MTKTKKKTISYNLRLIIVIVPLILSIICSFYYFDKSVKLDEQKRFTYEEKGKINYKVRLRDNDFYDKKVLDQNMSYIANLIDKIRINFNYDFKYDKKINNSYTYDVIGVLEILNSDTNEKFLTKEYNLVEEKTIDNFDKLNYNLKESITIDYKEYNKIAKDFKKNFNVNTTSKFNVILRVKRDIDKKISNPSDLNIEIPLTDKAVSIKVTCDDVNKKETINSNKKIEKEEKISLLKGLIYFAITILLVVLLKKIFFSLHILPTKYEESIERIKREYDRLLIEVTRLPKMDDYDVVELSGFDELIDLTELYGELIRYKEASKKAECYFYIVHNKEIYCYILKKA